MFCPNCGAEMPDNAKFCGKCGQRLEKKITANPESFAKATNSVYPGLSKKGWVDRCIRPLGMTEKSHDTEQPKEQNGTSKTKRFIYFRLTSGLYAKIDREGMTAYRFDPEKLEWNEDHDLFVDYSYGELHGFEFDVSENYSYDKPFDDQAISKRLAEYRALIRTEHDNLLERAAGNYLNKIEESVGGDTEIKIERKKSLYIGCLLGGAVGDALGYPVEFMSESEIRKRYGVDGIQTLSEAGDPALISDDTQMTLFAANGIIYSLTEKVNWNISMPTAYREWYVTQTGEKKLLEAGAPKMWIFRDQRLHHRRAPGNTCMSSIRNYIEHPGLYQANNNSKGCGTVMRAAPYGLMTHYDPTRSYGDDGYIVAKAAGVDAMLTHGHEDAHKASGLLADIIYDIVQRTPFHAGKKLQDILPKFNEKDEYILYARVARAVRLAENTAVSDLDAIHQLGEGWVADEALAIALFCAVRHQDDFASAIRAAVNHGGDSDSTGAICGNILGAWLGAEKVMEAFDINKLELQDMIIKVAEELFDVVENKRLG